MHRATASCQDLSTLPVPGRVTVMPLDVVLGIFTSYGICLFWWPESPEVRGQRPVCPVTLSKAVSTWGLSPPKGEPRVGCGL